MGSRLVVIYNSFALGGAAQTSSPTGQNNSSQVYRKDHSSMWVANQKRRLAYYNSIRLEVLRNRS